MSSKPKNQKPAAQKPEAETTEEAASQSQPDAEATPDGDASSTVATQPDAPAQADTVEDAGEPKQAESEKSALPKQPDADDPALSKEPEADSPMPVAPIETVAEVPTTVAPDGLSTRLTKAVNAILTSGKPDAVHSLHKVELIVGTLKTSLGAAIEACDAIGDEVLKADLQNLHAAL